MGVNTRSGKRRHVDHASSYHDGSEGSLSTPSVRTRSSTTRRHKRAKAREAVKNHVVQLPRRSRRSSSQKKPTQPQVPSKDHAARSQLLARVDQDSSNNSTGPSSPANWNHPAIPLSSCKHIKSTKNPILNSKTTVAILSPRNWLCSTCGTTDGVWACLHCPSFLCGRQQNRHAINHFHETGHPLVIDINTQYLFCYGCDAWISQDNSYEVISQLRERLSAVLDHHSLPLRTRSGCKVERQGLNHEHDGDESDPDLPSSETLNALDRLETANQWWHRLLLWKAFTAWKQTVLTETESDDDEDDDEEEDNVDDGRDVDETQQRAVSQIDVKPSSISSTAIVGDSGTAGFLQHPDQAENSSLKAEGLLVSSHHVDANEHLRKLKSTIPPVFKMLSKLSATPPLIDATPGPQPATPTSPSPSPSPSPISDDVLHRSSIPKEETSPQLSPTSQRAEKRSSLSPTQPSAYATPTSKKRSSSPRHRRLRNALRRSLSGASSRTFLKPLVEPGMSGLRNLGQTCYMNSVLQAMAHIALYRLPLYDLGKRGLLLPDQQGFPAPSLRSVHVTRRLSRAQQRKHSLARQTTSECFQEIQTPVPGAMTYLRRRTRGRKATPSSLSFSVSSSPATPASPAVPSQFATPRESGTIVPHETLAIFTQGDPASISEEGSSKGSSARQVQTPAHSAQSAHATPSNSQQGRSAQQEQSLQHATDGIAPIPHLLESLFRVLWSGKWAVLSPYAVLGSVWKVAPMFRGYHQQDAQEFLLVLEDAIADGLDEIEKRLGGYREPPLSHSILRSVFNGEMNSIIKCSHCGHKSLTHQRFCTLALDMPAEAYQGSRNDIALSSMLKSYFAPEVLEGDIYDCAKCSRSVSADACCDSASDDSDGGDASEERASVSSSAPSPPIGEAVTALDSDSGVPSTMGEGSEAEEVARTTPHRRRRAKRPVGQATRAGRSDGEATPRVQLRPIVKYSTIAALPSVLKLCIKRFSWGPVAREKLHTHVQLPPVLDLSECCDLDTSLAALGPLGTDAVYDLAAVITHEGNQLVRGHYKCYCSLEDAPGAVGGRWVLANDVRMDVVSLETVLAAQAYVAFYVHRGTTSFVMDMLHEYPGTPLSPF